MNLKSIWQKVSLNGIHNEMDFEEIKKIRIINQFAFVSFIISIIYTFFLLALSSPYLALFDFINAFNSVIILILVRKTNYKIASAYLFTFGPIGLLLFNYVYGRQGAEYYFLPMFILCFYIFRHGWKAISTLLFLIFLFFVAKYLEANIHPVGLAEILSPYFYYTSFIFAFIFGYLILRLFTIEYEKNKIEVEENNKLLKIAIEEANLKNEEIKTLMKELTHRTKNNLQLVSSLLNIQSKDLKDLEAKKAIEESKNRIISIALIHKKLYQNENLTKVFFKNYIEDLVDYLLNAFSDTTKNIKFSKDIDDFEIKIDNAVTLGLILNELITNSLKYGLIQESNFLEISIKKTELHKLEIIINDSGDGISKLQSNTGTESFGFNLVRSLVKQMDGEIFIAENGQNSIRIIVSI